MSNSVANGQFANPLLGRIIHSAWIEPAFANGLVVVCLTLMLTVSDAFDTGNLGLAHSVTLWMLVSLLIVVQVALLHRVFLVLLPRGPLASFSAAGLSLFATTMLMTLQLHGLKFTPLLPKHPDPFLEFFFFVAQPVVAAGCIVLLVQPVWIRKFVEALGAQEEGLNSIEGRRGELSQILADNDVFLVTSIDHYLELHSAQGKWLVRARMRDAIDLLAHREGAQVHRSHWVAREHVKNCYRQGRDLKLRLHDGRVIPVARSRAQWVARTLCQATG